jgi:queuosine biosynthesis protein QueC
MVKNWHVFQEGFFNADAVISLSGGLDSSTALAVGIEKGNRFKEAVSFYYGQRHISEIDKARDIAKYYGIKHDVVDLSSVFQSSCSTLLSNGPSLPVGSDADRVLRRGFGTSPTFVPGRNVIFLSVLASRAYTLGAQVIYAGMHRDDFGIRPITWDWLSGLVDSVGTRFSDGYLIEGEDYDTLERISNFLTERNCENRFERNKSADWLPCTDERVMSTLEIEGNIESGTESLDWLIGCWEGCGQITPSGDGTVKWGFDIPPDRSDLRNRIVKVFEQYSMNDISHLIFRGLRSVTKTRYVALVYKNVFGLVPSALSTGALYADCTPAFVFAMSNAVSIATENKVGVEAPLLWLSKADVAYLASKIGVPIEKTLSCYAGRIPACGECITCKARIEAFRQVNLEDRIEYAN